MDRRNFLTTAGSALIAANEVLGQNNEPGAGVIQKKEFEPLREVLSGKEPAIWVFTGDSITHGALHTFGWRSYVEHFSERVRWEMRRMTDIVINTGISGDTMKGIHARDDWRIFQFRPKVVSLKIGMNDCRDGEKGRSDFRQSLERFVEKAAEKRILVLLHTPNLIHFPNDPARKDLPAYVDEIRNVAEKHRLPLIDHYAYWTEETGGKARLQMWLNDGSIHPNGYGHLALARKIFLDLGIHDPASKVCGLFVP